VRGATILVVVDTTPCIGAADQVGRVCVIGLIGEPMVGAPKEAVMEGMLAESEPPVKSGRSAGGGAGFEGTGAATWTSLVRIRESGSNSLGAGTG